MGIDIPYYIHINDWRFAEFTDVWYKKENGECGRTFVDCVVYEGQGDEYKGEVTYIRADLFDKMLADEIAKISRQIID